MAKKRKKAKKQLREARRAATAAAKRAFEVFEAKRAAIEPPKEQVTEVVDQAKARGIRIDDTIIAQSRQRRRKAFVTAFTAAVPKPGVVPSGHDTIAMDEAITESLLWASQALYNGAWVDGQTFLGFPYLSELAQRPEYRRISEVFATEMTRKWIELKSTGESKDAKAKPGDPEAEGKAAAAELKADKVSEKIKAIGEYFDRLKVKERFRDTVVNDGFFGRAHLFLQVGDAQGIDDRAELVTSIGGGNDDTSALKVSQQKPLTRIQLVEPIWTYPSTYNSFDPLAVNFYNPDRWFVQGKEVHVSRLLTFVGREVPDLLKPAYQFGGLSLSQMAKPYVDNWLRTRQSVSDLISAFSVMVLSTDMAAGLQGGGDAFFKRVDLFNLLRDNRNTMVVDKNTEDLKNVSAPLGTLDALQAQSQEQICSVSGIPVVKYTGIQPAGLNADSDGVIRVWYDNVNAYQEKLWREPLTRILHFVQLSLWGRVDPSITFDFVKLHELTDKEAADVRKIEAETDDTYVNMGVLDPAEVREKIATDKDSPYHGLDPDDLPEPPPEEEPLAPGEEPTPGAPGGGGPQQPPKKPSGNANGRGAAADSVVPFGLAEDSEFVEADHPRDHGKFSSKPGAKGGKSDIPQSGKIADGTPPHHANRGAPISAKGLKKVGEQKGTNEGGVFEHPDGSRFYVKKGQTKDHVRNEMLAASLYALAGAPTLTYRPVEGGAHVATEMAKLDKTHSHKLSEAELKKAREDFAVHAWTGNYDAVGTGGDNLGTIGGVPTSLDLGGALEYRAQGKPKGEMFGDDVKEFDGMRNPAINPWAAQVYGAMTDSELKQSVMKVAKISDDAIRQAVKDSGSPEALAERLIARKKDLLKRAKLELAPAVPKGGILLKGTKVYRGASPENEEQSAMSGGKGVYVSLDHATSKQWGDVKQYELKDHANLIDLENYDSRAKEFVAKCLGIVPKKLTREQFEESGPEIFIQNDGVEHVKQMGFKGYRLGYDAFLLGKLSDHVGKGVAADMALDAPWDESKHPRGEGGQFAPKGQGGAGGKATSSDIVAKAKAMMKDMYGGHTSKHVTPLLSAAAKLQAVHELGGAEHPEQIWKTLTKSEKDALAEEYGSTDKAFEEAFGKADGGKVSDLDSGKKVIAKALEENPDLTVEELKNKLTNAEGQALVAEYGDLETALELENMTDQDKAELESGLHNGPEDDDPNHGEGEAEPGDIKFAEELVKDAIAKGESVSGLNASEEKVLVDKYGSVEEAYEKLKQIVLLDGGLTDEQKQAAIKSGEVKTLDAIAKKQGFGGWSDSLGPMQKQGIIDTQNDQYVAYAKKLANPQAELTPTEKSLHSATEKMKAGSPDDLGGLLKSLGNAEKDALIGKYGSLNEAWQAIGGKAAAPTAKQDLLSAEEKAVAHGPEIANFIGKLTDAEMLALTDKYGSPAKALEYMHNKSTAASTGGEKAKKTAFGGLYKTGATPAEAHKNTVDFVLTKTKSNVAGSSYRSMLKKLIEDSPKHGTEAQVPALKEKLASAYFNAGEKLGKQALVETDPAQQKKLEEQAKVAWAKAKELGHVSPGKQAEAEAPKVTPQLAAAAAPAVEQINIAGTVGKATLDEVKKAKKTTPIPQSAQSPTGQKLIENFNAKYAGKEVATPNAINQKVADYKATMAAVKKNDEAWQAASKAEQAAAAKAAAAKAQAEQAKAAKEAAAANKHVMDSLGINEQEAQGFHGLAEMLGASPKDLVNSFKHYEAQAKKHGYPISGFQAAIIANYTNGGYSSINQNLRQGSWTEKQHVYVKLMNKALQAMPAYKGVVQRGVTLPASAQALYKPGYVVEERAFTSTSISAPWSGNTKYHITAIGKRGAHVKKLSNHPGEDEVVFSARTFFKVTKVQQQGGVMHVHMEEMEHHD